MFSSIVKKKCKCSKDCDKWPTIGWKGYFSLHAPQELKDKNGSKAKVAARNKANKNALRRKLHEAQNVVSGAELQRWFENRRKEMVGFCDNCGMPSCKNDDKYYKFSICHLLPKAYFGSIKTHPLNWIELCFWGEKSCHSNMDHGMIDLIDMHCWDTIVQRFVAMYPSIAVNERKRIPNVLLQYIEIEK